MIDFFNRRKLDELEAENESLKSDVEALRSENERLTAKLRGERVCDGCCSICKHGVLTPTWFPTPMIAVNAFICDLECKCKDFERAHRMTVTEGLYEYFQANQGGDSQIDTVQGNFQSGRR